MLSASREWLHRVDCHLRRMLPGRQGCFDTGPSDKRTVELFYNTCTTVCRGMKPRGRRMMGDKRTATNLAISGARLRSVAVRVS